MQEIADWLRKLDLGQYAQRFAENAIDVAVLRHLTDEDLKELGIPLGHRRKIFAAIHKGSESIAPLAAPAVASESKAQDTPERRFVTVLFSDLVGSTALSARIDPEDLRDVISAYQSCVAATVHRFGGFVAKYMGDGVLVYFGYPEAHEDDPERAVGAGLELVAAVGDLRTHAPLQTRVGIATGLVVVGEVVGSGAAQEQAIVGKTPNLAARLQAIAEPDAVVIAESTRKLIGNLFELEDLGAKDLKGFAGGERTWAVLRASTVASRFEALHTSGLTELVGRQEELDLLLRRWAKVTAGEGQVVLLSGEAGIGKSRLTAALLHRLATEPHTRLRYFCSPSAYRQCTLSNHQSDGACRGIRIRGQRSNTTREAGCPARSKLHAASGSGAVCRTCRCRMMDAIPKPTSHRCNAANERSRRLSRKLWRLPSKVRY